jgi:hypothetical protein
LKRCDRQFLLHRLTACPTIPIPDGRSLSKQRAHSHSSSEGLHDAQTREPVDSGLTLPPPALNWTPSPTWMLPPRGAVPRDFTPQIPHPLLTTPTCQ